MRSLARLLLFLLALASPAGGAFGQDDTIKLADAPTLFAVWDADSNAVDKALETGWEGDSDDERRRALIERHRSDSRILADKARAAAVPLQEQLATLGPPPEGEETESEAIARERAELQKRVDDLKAVQSKAELAFTRADRQLERITEERRRKFTDRLLTRGPTPLDPNNWFAATQSLLVTTLDVADEIVDGSQQEARREVWSESGPLALTALLFAVVLMVVLRRAVMRWLYGVLGAWAPLLPGAPPVQDSDGNRVEGPSYSLVAKSRTRRLLVGIGITVTRLATPLVAIFAMRFALIELQIFGPTGVVVLNGVVLGIAIWATAYAIVYAFFSPNEIRLRLSLLDNQDARFAAWYAMAIATAMSLNAAVVDTGQALGWPVAALSVLNLAIITGGSLALWRFARVTAPQAAPEPEPDADTQADGAESWLSRGATKAVRRIAYAVALVSPLLALAGYFALSRFVFYNALLSAAVFAAGVLLFSVAKEGTSALSEASRGAKPTKVDEDDKDGGLLPVFFAFILILVALPILALIWGATRDDLSEAYFAISNGFTIGDSTFRPGDLLIAALVFGFGLFVTRIIQAVMRRTVMPRTRLDTGARSSIVSGLGYLGFFIAVLVAISAGGLDLTNLAFLGAALGVGIGFGLQNIVNNFVSGVILLIERPIKTGDWIEVTGIHGIVEKINVRSTEIKTFDKASYIVPNSDLISGAVTNMTHGDMLGRVIAPVGVAYGTDPRKVERVLMEIARAHPMVLRKPPPQVIFKGFGASSLDFELRGFLRDVMWVVATHSDLNFEIDRRFKEEGIEIPFSQTDMHIRDLDKLIETLGQRAAQAQVPQSSPPRGEESPPGGGT